MTLKVMTIVGTRPEIIKLSRVICALDRHTRHVLVHTGQNYDHELNGIFFEQLGLRPPDFYLQAVGATPAETIGKIIIACDQLISDEKPDALLLLGDTNSCLSVIAAKRRKVPVFHMEAGNRCFDQRVPEEINRRIVDHVSDINLTYTEHARRYLLSEGLRPETVIKTGSPIHEVLEYYGEQIRASVVINDLQLKSEQYFLVSAHREENIDDPVNFNHWLASLNTMAARYRFPVIVSTHPRTRKRLQTVDTPLDPLIRFVNPLGFFDYVHLQTHAACVVSDSGTITEEASIMNFPAITIRQAHERPEGMDEATVIMSGLKPEAVLSAIDVAIAQHSRVSRQFRLVGDYEPRNVSQKVVRIILSYTDYVRRTVWFQT
jgi:UDP-N-acetylglucosamine 2-epimerase (non-hydrolysing)